MPQLRRELSPSASTAMVDAPFDAVRAELKVPADFPPKVRQAAADAAQAGPRYDRVDATDLDMVTIDPPGSMDLDQAVHIQAETGGRTIVHYAIADVAAFVGPGGPVDTEAWERGVSRYSPDMVTPLHPRELSEGAASLLPDAQRPAILWTLTLDQIGELVSTDVRRARIRSRAKLTYADAQRAIDQGTDPMLALLAKVGRLRTEREWVRGGISLDLPDQEVHRTDDGHYDLRYRAPLPVEGWNAQVSLLTGQAAGQMMADAGVGILRTLPPPEVQTIDGLRQRAWALGLPWPPEVSYADFVRTLDPHVSTQAAMISMAAVGLRGAGYVAFDGELPKMHRHEAIAAVYAHVTAPLRRLVDRYANEVVLAIAGGTPVPDWVRERMDDLPRAMAQARSRGGALDRAMLDLVEAQVLSSRVGETFAAVAVRSREKGSEVQLRDPAVTAWLEGVELAPGTDVRLRLDAVDLPARRITLELLGQS